MVRTVIAKTSHPLRAGSAWLAVCAAAWLTAYPGFAQAPQVQPAPAPPGAQAIPQTPQPDEAPPVPPEAAPAKPAGFFDAFGRWFDKSARDFKASVDDANAKWRASVDETNAKLKAKADEHNAKVKASVDESNARWKAGIDENYARWRELSERSDKAAKEAAAAQKEAAEAWKNLANTRMIEGRQICELAPNGSPDCQAAALVICKGKGFSIGKSADITTARKCSARALLQRDESECRTETVVIKAACQ